MFIVELPYPLKNDVKEFNLPLPNATFEDGECFALIFDSKMVYYEYLNVLCTLKDKLLYDSTTSFEPLDKLRCVKQLSDFLINI